MNDAHSLLAPANLPALSARSAIPMPRLKQISNGHAASYFDSLRLYIATDGRLGPDVFRPLVIVTPRRTEPGKLHGETVWGTPLGHRFAEIIIEAKQSPKQWFTANHLKPQSMYRIFMARQFPRKQLIAVVRIATDGKIDVGHFHDPSWPPSLPIPPHAGVPNATNAASTDAQRPLSHATGASITSEIRFSRP